MRTNGYWKWVSADKLELPVGYWYNGGDDMVSKPEYQEVPAGCLLVIVKEINLLKEGLPKMAVEFRLSPGIPGESLESTRVFIVKPEDTRDGFKHINKDVRQFLGGRAAQILKPNLWGRLLKS